MIFIDTGAFLARFVQRDQHHLDCTRAWDELRGSSMPCVTSNFVLDETFTLLARRTDYAFAAQRARSLLGARELRILRPGHEDERAALYWFEKYADQRVSFTDCVSFALLRANRINRVFGFDKHFALAGFELWPEGGASTSVRPTVGRSRNAKG